MTSLRTRAVTGGIIWAVAIIVLGLASLSSYMTSQVQARFLELLDTRHTQVIVAVSNNALDPETFEQAIGDPVYGRPFSGQYWQIENTDGLIITSRSLVDLLLPRAEGLQTNAVRTEIEGPDGEPAIVIAQWLTLEDGQTWYVQVASSLQALEDEIAELRGTLLTAFAIVASIGVIGAWAQAWVVLQPLETLRKDVSTRWEQEDGLDVEGYPIEVAPLVTDINSLMERNREIMRRSRRQAADLAHAIKTPSAIMRNELDALASQGVDVVNTFEALNRLDAQLNRSFARMRADSSDDTVGVFTDLDKSLGRMQRAFTALARNAAKEFSATIAEGMRARIDQQDFEELMGNLLDNALKWAAGQVTLAARPGDNNTVIITIADDGPGIPEDQIPSAIVGGQRLDVSKPGTGLGLAIASDLVHAYSGTMLLEKSEDLGGLAIHIVLPIATKRQG